MSELGRERRASTTAWSMRHSGDSEVGRQGRVQRRCGCAALHGCHEGIEPSRCWASVWPLRDSILGQLRADLVLGRKMKFDHL